MKPPAVSSRSALARAETGPSPEKWAARDGTMPPGATSEDIRRAHADGARPAQSSLTSDTTP